MPYPLSYVNSDSSIAKYTVKAADWGSLTYFPDLTAAGFVRANAIRDVLIPVTKRFSPKRGVEWGRPDGLPDKDVISIAAVDCIAPKWVASTAVYLYNVNVANQAPGVIVVNGTLFFCTTAGTTTGTIPTNLTTQPAAGTTVSDGTAVWTSLGQRGAAVKLRFANASASASPVNASNQTYEFFQ